MSEGTTTTTAAISGCPSWCTTDHDNPDQACWEADLGAREHSTGVSGFWLHEIRGGGERPVVLRPRGTSVEVFLEQCEPFDGSGAGSAQQVAVRTLEEGLVLSLTPQEARSLAAILTAGADGLELAVRS